MLIRPVLSLALAASLLVPSLALAKPESRLKPVASVEGITEFRLENGLRVLLFPDPSKPKTTVNITYLVGSRDESYGETGMAHLLEHMLFRGTPAHRDIPSEQSARGAEANGTTSWDRTNYYESFPSSPENLEWALSLEADRMVNSFVSAEDLASEMTVVRNELEMGENDPASMLGHRTLSSAYLWHNYGRAPIGARSDIEGVDIRRLQAFYKKYYQPDNAVLLVAGRFDPPATLELIRKKFSVIPRPSRDLIRAETVEPAQDGERYTTLRRTGTVQSLTAVYHVPSGTHPDSAPAEVLLEALSSTPSGRLYRSLVETGIVSEVSGFGIQGRDPGVIGFELNATLEQDLEEAERILLQEAENLAENPITERELTRAKGSILKEIELFLSSTDQVGIALSEFIAMGDWRFLFLYRDRIEAVTLADVNRVADAYLKRGNRTIGRFIPSDKPVRVEIPAALPVGEQLKDYRSARNVSEGAILDTAPLALEKLVERIEISPWQKVAMLPKQTRGDIVNGHITLRFGTGAELAEWVTAAELAGPLLLTGTKDRSKSELHEELDRLRSDLSITSSTNGLEIGFRTKREYLQPLLELIEEILHRPVYSEQELEVLRKERLTGLAEAKSNPEAVALLLARKHLRPYPAGDVRYVRSIEESEKDLLAVTADDIRRFDERFLANPHVSAGFVGSFDKQAVLDSLAKLFPKSETPSSFERVVAQHFDVPRANLKVRIPEKQNSTVIGGVTAPLSLDDPDAPLVLVANQIVGGGFLDSRLAKRIRRKDGLSYGVGSSFNVNPLDKAAVFSVVGITAPQNVEPFKKAMLEELVTFRKGGPSDEEMKRAVSGLREAWSLERSDDAALAAELAEQVFLGRTFEWQDRFERTVAGATATSVREAFAQRVDPEKLSIFVAGEMQEE